MEQIINKCRICKYALTSINQFPCIECCQINAYKNHFEEKKEKNDKKG